MDDKKPDKKAAKPVKLVAEMLTPEEIADLRRNVKMWGARTGENWRPKRHPGGRLAQASARESGSSTYLRSVLRLKK